MHIAIDIRHKPRQTRKLWTSECVSSFLRRAVTLTGLHRISESVVVQHEEKGLLHIDGHVMIAESHVHVTLVPQAGQGWVDVFSCRIVDIGLVTIAAAESFGGNQFVRPVPRTELTERRVDAD